MGCKARGQPGQPFSHKNGHGYVKAHRGFYHDAIFVKRNNFKTCCSTRRGGGFSPTAVLKLCAASRAKSRAAALTARPTRPSTRSLLCPTHAERISLSVVRGVNRAIRSHPATLSARLGEQGARPQMMCEC